MRRYIFLLFTLLYSNVSFSQKMTLAIYPTESKSSFDIQPILKNITNHVFENSARFTLVKKPEEFIVASKINRDSIKDFDQMTKSGAQFILFFESSEFDLFRFQDTLVTTSKEGKVQKREVFSPIVSLQTSFKLINISTGEIVSNFNRFFESDIYRPEDAAKSSYNDLINSAKGQCIGRLNSSIPNILFQLENDAPIEIEIESIVLEEKEKCKKVLIKQTKNSGVVKGMTFNVSYLKTYLTNGRNEQYWVWAANLKVKDLPDDSTSKVTCTVTEGEEILLKLLKEKSKIKINYLGIKRGLW